MATLAALFSSATDYSDKSRLRVGGLLRLNSTSASTVDVTLGIYAQKQSTNKVIILLTAHIILGKIYE
jgi:hypothetical protein